MEISRPRRAWRGWRTEEGGCFPLRRMLCVERRASRTVPHPYSQRAAEKLFEKDKRSPLALARLGRAAIRMGFKAPSDTHDATQLRRKSLCVRKRSGREVKEKKRKGRGGLSMVWVFFFFARHGVPSTRSAQGPVTGRPAHVIPPCGILAQNLSRCAFEVEGECAASTLKVDVAFLLVVDEDTTGSGWCEQYVGVVWNANIGHLSIGGRAMRNSTEEDESMWHGVSLFLVLFLLGRVCFVLFLDDGGLDTRQLIDGSRCLLSGREEAGGRSAFWASWS